MPRTRDGSSDMDWDKLKVFHAAAEAGSFTHAGDQLGLSQSAVSRQVIALEHALAINWLIPRLDEFTALYPDIRISLIVTDEDLDLSMREADVAIRTRKPTQPDLIQRKLFSIRFHAYCTGGYIK